MELLSGKQAASRVAGILHANYQVHAYSVQLTVRNVWALDPEGHVDFGGNEYLPAGKLPLTPRRLRPEDRYEWWDLERGSYFVEFNEALNLGPDEIALLEPEQRLLRAGAAHEPLTLRGHSAPIEVLLHVGALRLRLARNARISRVRIFRLPSAKRAAKKPGRRLKKAPTRRKK